MENIEEIKEKLNSYLNAGFMKLHDFLNHTEIVKSIVSYLNNAKRIAIENNDTELLELIDKVIYKNDHYKEEEYAYCKNALSEILSNSKLVRKDGIEISSISNLVRDNGKEILSNCKLIHEDGIEYELLDVFLNYPFISLTIIRNLCKSNYDDLVKLDCLIGNDLRINRLGSYSMTEGAIRGVKKLTVNGMRIDVSDDIHNEAIRIIKEYSLPRDSKIVKQLLIRLCSGKFDELNSIKSR